MHINTLRELLIEKMECEKLERSFICENTGVSKHALSRFLKGKGIGAEGALAIMYFINK